jgi:hypothetical protein
MRSTFANRAIITNTLTEQSVEVEQITSII